MVVDEEVVGLYVVGPAVHFVVSPPVPFFVDDESGDEELFHGSGVDFVHSVELHVVLQHGTHGFGLLLFFAVACHAGRFGGLLPEYADYVSDESVNEVVLERYVSLFEDILLLGDGASVHADFVPPLVTVVLAFVSFAVVAELVHGLIVCLCLQEYIHGSAVFATWFLLAGLYAVELGRLYFTESMQIHCRGFFDLLRDKGR